MKKITLAIAALFTSALAYGQVYYVPANPGNPGSLNADDEFPRGGGLDASWTDVQGPSATPTWSSNQTIPFSFTLNGSAKTQYKVSTTGIVTFDLTAASVPSATKASLPSSSIPDNSICVWGIETTGGNDYVVSKTFGTAPNRQHWIFFPSSTNPGTGSGWTYWSIVLEETSNNIYIVDQRHSGAPDVSIGVQFNSTTAVSHPASPSVAAFAGTDPSPADNIYYTFMPGVQPAYDLAGIELQMSNAEDKKNAPFTIIGNFQNLGTIKTTSAEVNYTVNGGAPVTGNVTGLNIGKYAKSFISHPTKWNPTTTGEYVIKMWVSKINSNNDANPANDTITHKVIVLNNPPKRMVVIEEKTGTWCGWCPRGAVGMEYMSTTYDKTTATIAVHNGDPMVVTDYDGNIGLVAPGGYPGSAVDRVLGPDPNNSDLESAYNERQAVTSFVKVMQPELVSYNAGTKELKIKIKVVFKANLSGNFKMNLVLTEDGVTGTSSGYAQANYYSGGGSGNMGGYENKANPVPASQMVYDHVARAIVGGFEGSGANIPSNVVDGTVYEETFTYTLGSTENIGRFTAIGMVTDGDTYEVLNASKVKMWDFIGIDEVEAINFNIYPNPANDYLNVVLNADNDSYRVDMVNMLGQTVLTSNINNSISGDVITLNTSDLNAGIYMVKITVNGKTSTQKVTIQ